MKLLHLTSLLAVVLLAIPGGATARQPKFGDDGKFKIIQFTDAHVRADKPDEMAKTLDRLVRTIDAEAPDMIVFTGDVVTGRPAAKAWRAILDPVARRNIPFVVVLGNHDREQDLREEQIAQLVTAYPNSLNAAEDGRLSDIAVPIISGDSERTAAVLYCIDSNDYSTIEGLKNTAGYDSSRSNITAAPAASIRSPTEESRCRRMPFSIFHCPSMPRRAQLIPRPFAASGAKRSAPRP